MLDVLRSTTTTPGELCVITVLTIETQTSPAICSDMGDANLFYAQLSYRNRRTSQGQRTQSRRLYAKKWQYLGDGAR